MEKDIYILFMHGCVDSQLVGPVSESEAKSKTAIKILEENDIHFSEENDSYAVIETNKGASLIAY